MPNLKELKNRISSVKSTRKITSAMKMVAASKLRRAQELAESSRVYADSLSFILSSLAGNTKNSSDLPEILTCLLYTSPSPRDATLSRMPSSA